MSIRTKIIYIAIAILVLAQCANTFISSYVFTGAYEQAMASRGLIIAQNLQSQLDRLLRLGIPLQNLEGFDEQCQEIVKQYDDVAYVAVVDTTGEILFHNDAAYLHTWVTEPRSLAGIKSGAPGIVKSFDGKHRYVNAMVPVMLGSEEHIATIMLGFPQRIISQKTHELLFYAGSLGAAFLVCAILLLLFTLSTWVTKPLRQFVSLMATIRSNALDFHPALPLSTDDEIGQLSVAFNAMMARLTMYDQAVQQYTLDLTSTVEARTADLRLSNDHLQHEIAERIQVEEALRQAGQTLRERAALAELEAEVSWAMATSENLAEVLGQCAEAVVRHLEAVQAQFWTLDMADHVLELQAQAGSQAPCCALQRRVPVGQGALGRIAQQQEPCIMHANALDSESIDADWAAQEGIVSCAGVPLMVGERLGGVMVIHARRLLSAVGLQLLETTATNIAMGLERLHARQALQESELRFRQLAEHIHEMFYLCEVSSAQMLYMSPAYEQIWGGSVQALYQQSARLIDAVHPEDRPQVEAMLTQGAQGEDSYAEYRIVRPDGAVRWILDRAFPFRTSPEGGYRIAGVAEDITERKQTEEALRQMRDVLEQRVLERTAALSAANRELAKATRLKDEFLASMSHELRTPLNAILGLSEALQEQVYGTLTGQQMQSLRHIEESGRHLLALITDILDLSKIEAGKCALQVAPVEVVRVCQASLAFIKNSATKKHLTVTFHVDQTVGHLLADARRLKQILVNLLSNAVKFTPPEGHIGLEVIGHADEHSVSFTVWDTGIGIAEEDQKRLFQPFVQLDSSLARHHAGTGLGLSLVARLAALHGGHVTLSSTPGQGSRFRLVLPWQEGATAEARAGAESLSRVPSPLEVRLLSQVPPQPAADTGPLVLLAEDNELNVATVVQYLQTKGYRLAVASNGMEVLERARALRPALILMDIQMPGMDGLEATRRLRAEPDPAVAATPIIALTALAMADDRVRCLAAGANAYMAKPCRLSGLLQAIETYLPQ